MKVFFLLFFSLDRAFDELQPQALDSRHTIFILPDILFTSQIKLDVDLFFFAPATAQAGVLIRPPSRHRRMKSCDLEGHKKHLERKTFDFTSFRILFASKLD